MPATRSRQSSRKPLRTHPNGPLGPDHNVITLSSDDESSNPNKMPKRKRATPSRQKGTLPVSSTSNVIEISSDEESGSSKPPVSCNSIAMLRKQLKEAQKEVERLQAEVHVRDQEVLRDRSTESQDKFISSLEDSISCEVCTHRLWTPYVLPCGHTFCQSCLTAWFSTAHAQHMSNHPNYNAGLPQLGYWRTALRQPHLPPHIRHEIQARVHAMETQPQPQYTCPSCRSQVKTKPVEVYALKSIVRTVASALGETSPKKPAPAPAATRTRSSTLERRVDAPWDGFFPFS